MNLHPASFSQYLEEYTLAKYSIPQHIKTYLFYLHKQTIKVAFKAALQKMLKGQYYE